MIIIFFSTAISHSQINQSMLHFVLGRSLTVHHAIPVSVCPGSPGGGYYAPLPLPRHQLRLNQLTLHPAYYAHHHQQDDGTVNHFISQ